MTLRNLFLVQEWQKQNNRVLPTTKKKVLRLRNMSLFFFKTILNEEGNIFRNVKRWIQLRIIYRLYMYSHVVILLIFFKGKPIWKDDGLWLHEVFIICISGGQEKHKANFDILPRENKRNEDEVSLFFKEEQVWWGNTAGTAQQCSGNALKTAEKDANQMLPF